MFRRRLGLYLTFKSKYLRAVLKGRKTATVRLGVVKPANERVFIECGGIIYGEAVITEVQHLKVSGLTEEHAIKDGFNNLSEMVGELKKIYPNIKADDWVTVLEFKVTDVYHPPMPRWKIIRNPAKIARLALAYGVFRTECERHLLRSIAKSGNVAVAASENGVALRRILEVLSFASSRLRSLGFAV